VPLQNLLEHASIWQWWDDFSRGSITIEDISKAVAMEQIVPTCNPQGSKKRDGSVLHPFDHELIIGFWRLVPYLVIDDGTMMLVRRLIARVRGNKTLWSIFFFSFWFLVSLLIYLIQPFGHSR
jgi:hypothetical protein